MKKTSSNVLKTVCVFALICIIVWLVFYAIQTYFVLTTGRGNGVLNWDSPHIGRKLTVFVINRITILTLAGLMAAFVHNISSTSRVEGFSTMPMWCCCGLWR